MLPKIPKVCLDRASLQLAKLRLGREQHINKTSHFILICICCLFPIVNTHTLCMLDVVIELNLRVYTLWKTSFHLSHSSHFVDKERVFALKIENSHPLSSPIQLKWKLTEKLVSANGTQMKIKYQLNNAHVCHDNVCFKIPYVLVKNMTDKVILGLSFINALYPFLVEHDGITTNPFGQKVKFKFMLKWKQKRTFRREKWNRLSVQVLPENKKDLLGGKSETEVARSNLHRF